MSGGTWEHHHTREADSDASYATKADDSAVTRMQQPETPVIPAPPFPVAKKVLVLCEHGHDAQYHATAFIRLLRPLRHYSIREAVDVHDGVDLPDESFDVVILERFWRRDVSLPRAEALVERIRRRCACFLYEIDDNLLDLDPDEPLHQEITSEKRSAVHYFLREADGVIVSTPQLAERLKALNKRIVVIPNALDEQLFPDIRAEVAERQRDIGGGPVVFGYMGTATHAGDLMMVLEPLRAVLHEFRGRVEFQLAGGTVDDRVLKGLDGLAVTRHPVPGSCFPYPYFAHWASTNMKWDFGIAPLEDTSLNYCKSDIKYLDYAILGIPGVFSNFPSYARAVETGKTGLLCGPDPEEWQSALRLMITDGEARSRMALAAYDAVRSKRTLATRAVDWLKAIEVLSNTR